MTKVIYRVFGDKTFMAFRGLRYTKVHTKALTAQGVRVIVDKTYVTEDIHSTTRLYRTGEYYLNDLGV